MCCILQLGTIKLPQLMANNLWNKKYKTGFFWHYNYNKPKKGIWNKCKCYDAILTVWFRLFKFNESLITIYASEVKKLIMFIVLKIITKQKTHIYERNNAVFNWYIYANKTQCVLSCRSLICKTHFKLFNTVHSAVCI